MTARTTPSNQWAADGFWDYIKLVSAAAERECAKDGVPCQDMPSLVLLTLLQNAWPAGNA